MCCEVAGVVDEGGVVAGCASCVVVGYLGRRCLKVCSERAMVRASFFCIQFQRGMVKWIPGTLVIRKLLICLIYFI